MAKAVRLQNKEKKVPQKKSLKVASGKTPVKKSPTSISEPALKIAKQTGGKKAVSAPPKSTSVKAKKTASPKKIVAKKVSAKTISSGKSSSKKVGIKSARSKVKTTAVKKVSQKSPIASSKRIVAKKVAAPIKKVASKKPAAPPKKVAAKKAVTPVKKSVSSVSKPAPIKQKATKESVTKKVKPKKSVEKKAVIKEITKPVAKKKITKASPQIAKPAAPKKVSVAKAKTVVVEKVASSKKASVSSKKRRPASAKKAPRKPREKVIPLPVLEHPIESILITQPQPENGKSPFFELASKFNLNLSFHPFIRVEGVAGRDFRKQRVDIMEHSAIILNSRSAVDHFFRIAEELKLKISQEMKYFCGSEAVALYLQKFILYRKRKVFFSADGSTKGLLDVIAKHKNERYMLPVSDNGKNEIRTFLNKNKIAFSEVVMFRTLSNDIDEAMKSRFDMIVFFSPFSVQTLLEHSPGFKQNGVLVGAFGPTTSKAVTDHGLRLDVKAPAPNAPSMVAALDKFFTALDQ